MAFQLATQPWLAFVLVGACQAATLVTWGSLSRVAQPENLTNATAIYGSAGAFSALQADGSVVAWGSSKQGGDASTVQAFLTNVTAIYSNSQAFAALKADGGSHRHHVHL
ncbi:unnamed protein product [Polarella glacialis]|uniref:Uncharacterized protein n=1 Tax=Polarella glacialis TaxID=89957 RepID=A0A813J6H2_POLGL|nr:unnamed protein product [Polarella glacialis]CAE8720038.1 unnamed protein product [Polarella glacialis]